MSIDCRNNAEKDNCGFIGTLVEDLNKLRNEDWNQIFNEAVAVAKNIGWPQHLEEELKRKRKRLDNEDDDQKAVFKREVFNVILDSVIGDMAVRFESVRSLCESFSVLWLCKEMTADQIQEKATAMVQRYPNDLGDELTEELLNSKLIYSANFGEKTLSPWDLLNAIKSSYLENLFPNVIVVLRIFCTISATIVSAGRSFSVLKRVKNVLRATMCQDRLSSLGVLAVEPELTRNTNLDDIINDFAIKKARKGKI